MKRSGLYITILFALFLHNKAAYGQQGLYFSQYIQDAMVFNPAYAGAKESLILTAQNRMQWVKTEAAPGFQGFSAHTPLRNQNLGLGLKISNDRVPGIDQQTVSPVLAYRIHLTANRFIAAGLQTSFIRQRPALKNIHLRDPDDPAFYAGRAAISASFGTGIYYAAERFYAGLAIPDLFPDVGNHLSQGGFRQQLRSYIFHSGLVLELNPELKIKPNMLVAIPETGSIYADVNLHLLVREVLWLGGSYRFQQGFAFMTQLQLNPQLAFGYSYDIPLQQQSYIGVSSHELSVQYRFYYVKSGVKSPRYF